MNENGVMAAKMKWRSRMTDIGEKEISAINKAGNIGEI